MEVLSIVTKRVTCYTPKTGGGLDCHSSNVIKPASNESIKFLEKIQSPLWGPGAGKCWESWEGPIRGPAPRESHPLMADPYDLSTSLKDVLTFTQTLTSCYTQRNVRKKSLFDLYLNLGDFFYECKSFYSESFSQIRACQKKKKKVTNFSLWCITPHRCSYRHCHPFPRSAKKRSIQRLLRQAVRHMNGQRLKALLFHEKIILLKTLPLSITVSWLGLAPGPPGH